MKAKFYTLILSALLLAGIPAKAQFADNRDYRNDDAGIVINNYYDDYDYYYSSRINRFHRSYAAFDYYSPVFTETYWYNYQPYSWGTSIYGRSALGFGFTVNFPVYYYGWGTDYWYDYNYGWYDPYYGSSWYWGYDPFYYSWYSPVYININIGPRWGHNYWYGRNFWHNEYRPVYHTTNNYYYDNYSNRNSYRSMPDRNRTGEYNRSTGGSSRRESVPSSGRVNQAGSRSSEGQVNINQGRRTAPDNNSRGNPGNAGNNANNANNGNNQNSRTDGNNGNFDRNDRNMNNNGNNNNSRPGGNNGNFGDKGRVTTSPAAPSRTKPSSTYSAPSGRSSSQRSGNTVSQGKSSSGRSANNSGGQSTRSGSSSNSKSSSKSSSGSRSSESKNSSTRR